MRKRPKIIIYATCQGEYLTSFLRCSEALTGIFDLVYLSNISRPGAFCPVEIKTETLSTCVLFLYHKVRSPRNIGAVRDMITQLPRGAMVVPVPYITSNLYWPLFDSVLNPLGPRPDFPLGLFPYRLSYVDALVNRGVREDEIMRRFQEEDLLSRLDLEGLRRNTFDYWSSLDKEGEGYLNIAEFLKNNWQKQVLFYLYNHPSQAVFLHLANQVLELLRLPALFFEQIRKVPCAQDAMYAVDPALSGRLGLEFARETSRYHYRRRVLTYNEFISFYIRAASLLFRGDKLEAQDMLSRGKPCAT